MVQVININLYIVSFNITRMENQKPKPYSRLGFLGANTHVTKPGRPTNHNAIHNLFLTLLTWQLGPNNLDFEPLSAVRVNIFVQSDPPKDTCTKISLNLSIYVHIFMVTENPNMYHVHVYMN